MSGERIYIAHISDPHFGTSTPEKVLALSTALKYLNPDYVILSGDITQRARQHQFAQARNFCESLKPLDVLAIPGNHDIPLFNIPARLFKPYYGFEKHFGFPLNSSRKKGSIEIKVLNTTHPMRHIQGQLGEKGRLAISQFSTSSRLRIAVTHHPLDCPKNTDEKNLLKDSPSALQAFQNCKVDLLLSGHIHDPLARLSNVRYPHGTRPFIVSLAGTCLSSRTRANTPNSFNFLRILLQDEAIDLDIVRYDLSPGMAFSPKEESRFRREGLDHWRALDNTNL